jgi:hypothetical protein
MVVILFDTSYSFISSAIATQPAQLAEKRYAAPAVEDTHGYVVLLAAPLYKQNRQPGIDTHAAE